MKAPGHQPFRHQPVLLAVEAARGVGQDGGLVETFAHRAGAEGVSLTPSRFEKIARLIAERGSRPARPTSPR